MTFLSKAKVLAYLASVFLILFLNGCPKNPDSVIESNEYEARIIRTEYGVPHIWAKDYAGLGYGEGYVAAQDHACNIIKSILEARGEMAMHFGVGEEGRNLHRDIVLAAVNILDQADAAFSVQSDEIKGWVDGYVAGFNRFLVANSISAGSWCEGAAWVRPITVQDLFAKQVYLAQSSLRNPEMFVNARAPIAKNNLHENKVVLNGLLGDLIPRLDMGSNAWAIGKERSANGRGLLLANPHYPWYGSRRFWEKHLTIPDRLDVYGVHLLGFPGVSIGFNSNVAWSHTVSDSQRFVFYRLNLIEGNPSAYLVDGKEYRIEEKEVVIDVRDPSGDRNRERFKVYFSHLGPMVALPGMEWTKRIAYTLRDANVGNFGAFAQWKAMSESRSMNEFTAAHARWNAMPWVNTISVDKKGLAVYFDNSTVGNVSDHTLNAWKDSLQSDPVVAALYQNRGMFLFDGSKSVNDWIIEPSAPLPGTVPYHRRPRIERQDYLFNANDSYWLSNAKNPVIGYSPLYGPTKTARSLRTRVNAKLLESKEIKYDFDGHDNRFDMQEIQKALFSNQSLTAELLLPDLISVCIDYAASRKKMQEACEVLKSHDGNMDLENSGSVLFREWLTGFSYADTFRKGNLFDVPFNLEKPLGTPSGLNRAQAREKLEAAIYILELADLPLDILLGEVQFAYRDEEKIPVHGGNRYEGVANLQVTGDISSPIYKINPAPVGESKFLTEAGYAIAHGSSFILTVGFTDDTPVAEALLTYSQSGNPKSQNFVDQTKLYSAKKWRPVYFSEHDVLEHAESTIYVRSSDL